MFGRMPKSTAILARSQRHWQQQHQRRVGNREVGQIPCHCTVFKRWRQIQCWQIVVFGQRAIGSAWSHSGSTSRPHTGRGLRCFRHLAHGPLRAEIVALGRRIARGW